jgi:flagellar biosynthetic protein FliP
MAVGAAAQQVPLPHLSVGFEETSDPQEVATSIKLLIILTILSLAPALLAMTTAFSRIVIVLSFLRSALGTQNIPPNQIVVGLSLFLTFFVMAPTFQRINEEALQPYLAERIGFQQAFVQAQRPIKDFMLRQTYTKDLKLFLNLRKEAPPATKEELPLLTLIPAFIVSELKTAFMIGFYIYVPFLVVDLVVASTLMSMGMMMMPPVVVSLPAKILVFLLADGWGVLVQTLVTGFR